MRTLMQLAGAAAIAYALLLAGVYLFQSRLIYFPNIAGTNSSNTPARLGFGYEDIRFVTHDGVELHAWFIPAEPSRGVLLFMHGNAGNITHRLDSIAQFHRLGLSVFIFDYRGYGQSQGRPNEAGTYADAAAAWRYLTQDRQIPPNEIVLFGRSLGAAIAAQQAVQPDVEAAALIIESAFTSAPDVAATYYWFLPVHLLARLHYDTRSYIERNTAPMMVIHSADDEIIPVEHGEILFNVANEPKTYLELRGGHNDGFFVSEPHYSEGIDAFLSQHLRTRGYIR